MLRQCEHTLNNGTRCKSPALRDQTVCISHTTDPQVVARRHQARVQGGKSRSKPRTVLPMSVGDVRLQSAGDVVALLAETVSQLRRGQLDNRLASTTGYLCSIVLRAIEGSETERRLQALELRLQGKAG
jgi:hypothetical protein